MNTTAPTEDTRSVLTRLRGRCVERAETIRSNAGLTYAAPDLRRPALGLDLAIALIDEALQELGG